MEAAPPAVLPLDLVEEILLRLTHDEPGCILRAFLVCKAWGRAVSRRSFRRRLQELYPAPAVLGFLHNCYHEHSSHFIPTTASSFSLPAPDHRIWRPLDCRHGRALFLTKGRAALELLVWEPITGGERLVPLPPMFADHYSSDEPNYLGVAVFCAADGCDCHGDPFHLVFLFNVRVTYDVCGTLACVYSSESGTWGEPTSVRGEGNVSFSDYSSVLVGRSLLYFLSNNGIILEYDLERHDLAVFDAPHVNSYFEKSDRLYLVLAEDGGMRVSHELYPLLEFWKRAASDSPDDPQWVLTRVINLSYFLQIGVVREEHTRVFVVGFAEGANVIFVDTVGGIFTIELQSEKVRKVCDADDFYSNLIPVVVFYTPISRGEHHDPSSSGPSEEACGEEGGEDKKAVEQPQQLFDKGSNAIEEEDFVSVGFSHALKTRVPSYEEVPLQCPSTEYGCALLQKAQEVDDPLDDVPKIVPNEESVTGAADKDDAGKSKTSRSDVEHSAAPSTKGDTEEDSAPQRSDC